MLRHGFKVEVLSLKHQPTLPSVHRHETRNVGPLKVLPPAHCGWLFLVLAMRARGAPLTKTNGKITTLFSMIDTIMHDILSLTLNMKSILHNIVRPT